MWPDSPQELSQECAESAARRFTSGISLVTCDLPRVPSVRNRQSHGKPPLLLRFYPEIPHLVSNPDRVMGSSPHGPVIFWEVASLFFALLCLGPWLLRCGSLFYFRFLLERGDVGFERSVFLFLRFDWHTYLGFLFSVFFSFVALLVRIRSADYMYADLILRVKF